MSEALTRVIAYHLRTKHQPQAMARGPARMDWANQPDPFRSYEGAPHINLERSGFIDAAGGHFEPSDLNMRSLSMLFFESLALSGQKSLAGSKWYLRVNPSSGNLHPTEGYLITGPIEGLEGSPGVYHYAPKDHALELLANVKGWQSLGLPDGTMLIGLSSIYWRESWKYGERAFRYCMIDLGHALAAVTVAAHCLGWATTLWDDPGTDDLARLLGLGTASTAGGSLKGQDQESRSEKESPDVLLAIFTDGKAHGSALDSAGLSRMELQTLPVVANTLSPEHALWPQIDLVSEAAKKPATVDVYAGFSATDDRTASKFCRVLRKRRSAQAMDGKTSMKRESFHAILEAASPSKSPSGLLPWRPHIHPVIFLHRVEDLEPGLYILLRDRTQKENLRAAMLGDFVWEKPSRTPEGLDLYLLAQGDGRPAARETSCRQSIASDGCFAASMIAEFEGPLHEYGPWFYSRLHWECGMIAQAFYLASEACGFQGCGIGCFFDDMVHSMLGLSGLKYQDLYHFTVGRALADPRLVDLPAYDSTKKMKWPPEQLLHQ
jgi:SagB-type dehydrogenase family enzyme